MCVVSHQMFCAVTRRELLLMRVLFFIFCNCRSAEVLGLISKILGFSQADQEEVGLLVASGSVVASLWSSFLPGGGGTTTISPPKQDLEVSVVSTHCA